MAKAGWVDIVHPSGLTSEVLESALPAWEGQGWTRADNGSEEVAQPAPVIPSTEPVGNEPPINPTEE